jgi:hypothetical protein
MSVGVKHPSHRGAEVLSNSVESYSEFDGRRIVAPGAAVRGGKLCGKLSWSGMLPVGSIQSARMIEVNDRTMWA